MPQKRSAYKELRKAKKRHLRNISTRSELKSLIKKFLSFIKEKKSEEARLFFKEISSKLDKAANKGIIRKNTASRRKSRLSEKLFLLQTEKK